jgi:hypothetical protein
MARKRKPTRRATGRKPEPTMFFVNVGGTPGAVTAIAPAAPVSFRLTITDNASAVSTNGKVFVEGAGPGSVPVLPENVVVTPGSPVELSLPRGNYVYWFVAQGNCAFTLNEESDSGEHGAWRSYTSPTMDAFHFSVRE